MKDEIVDLDQLLQEVHDLRQRLEELEAENFSLKQRLSDAGELPRKAVRRAHEDSLPSASEVLEIDKDYRSVAQTASVAICITQDGVLQFVNPAGTQLTGYSQEELLSKPFPALTHPDDVEKLTQIYLTKLRGEYVAPGHRFRIIGKDGGIKWVESWSASIPWKGRPAVLSILRDVTRQVQNENLLRQAHDDLDRRVQERAAELQETNNKLALEVQEHRHAEVALRKSEERYRSLFDRAPIGIISVDREGRIGEINQKLLKLLGSPSVEVSKGINVLTFPLLVEAGVSEVFKKCIECAKPQGAEFPYTSQWGKSSYMRLLVTPLHDLKGEVLGCQAMVEDVTERRNAEDALNKSQVMLSSILNSVQQSIFWKDRDSVYLGCNEVFARAVGLENPHQIVGKTDYDLPWPREEADAYRADDQEVMTNNLVKRHIIEPLQQADGTRLWIDTTKVPLRDVAGTICGVLGVYDDVTERKQAEEALILSERRLRQIIDLVPHFIFAKDADGLFILANKAVAQAYGTTVEGLTGRRDEDFAKSEEDVVHFRTDDLDVIHSGRPKIIPEEQMTDSDGNVRFLSTAKIPFTFSGASSPSMLGVSVDITERRRAEEKIRESEERLRLAWETSPDALSISRLKDGVYVDVNSGYTFLTGLSREEVVGRSALDVPFWADLRDRGPFAAALEQHGHVRNFQTKLRRKDGETRTCLISAGLMTLEGEPHLLAVTKDIEDLKRAEAALRESEQKYRLLAENVSDVIWITDLRLKVRYVSPSVERLNGWTTTEWMSMKPSDYLTPASVELVLKVLGDELALQGTAGLDPNRVRTLELEQYRKDGTTLWTEVLARFLYDEKQALIGIIGVTRDVSERKKTDKAIKSIVAGVSAEIGEKFFESSVVHFAEILNADFTLIGEISQRGQTPVVRTIAFCSGGALQENFEYGLKDAPCEKVLQRGVCSYPIGVRELFPRDEGLQRMNVEAYVGVCLYNSRGTPIGIMAAMYRNPLESVEFIESVLRIFASRAAAEIERKRVEAQLERLGAAVESAGETIVVTDAEGAIIYVNPTFEETTGYSREEAIGQNPRILKSGKHDRAFYQGMWNTLLAGHVWRGRFINRKKDRTLYEETATISPIKDKSGRIVNYVAVKRDVTVEAMLQKQLLQAQKMEAIGTLAGGIAHDFNNLLQAILGYSDLLLMKKGPRDRDRRKLEVIEQAARDGADLVSRILTFSRKAESRTRPIDLNNEIRKAQELLRRTVPRMIEIKLMLDDSLHVIDADPAQIEQILLNLAVNAQHAMPNGGRFLIETSNVSLSDEYLRIHLGARPGKYVLLTVSDTGLGMDSDVLERIFDPFFTTKTNGEGTGLGLAMVHGIVSQRGGYIRCYSEPGSGTSFKIYFPVSAGELAPDLTLTREMPALGTETILLVDDDERVREMARQLIEMGGYTVLTAGSGEEALERYSGYRAEISLVILDLIMPGMGGKRCLEELLRIDPHAKVLVASGYSSNGITCDEGLGSAKGFISKPYDAKDILRAIRMVLDRGRL